MTQEEQTRIVSEIYRNIEQGNNFRMDTVLKPFFAGAASVGALGALIVGLFKITGVI
ncbi:MAG: hypothetical protein GDA39_03505 [Hyphomonadaceae bacterium]|nr:hypothetical protein [Hyphomonadaceae bacterium]MBC6412014.1 hypothetical protein [Hyphomonadaceae bacterium]